MTFDAVSAGNNNPVTSLTYSHTCSSNSDRVLLVAIWTEQTSDLVTSVTYNSVAMTRVATDTQGTQRVYLYILTSPSSGANDVVISTSSGVNIHSVSASYYDVGSSQPDSSNTGVQASGATLTLSTTVVNSGCWLVSCAANEANGLSASTGTTSRTSGSGVIRMGDSNGTVGTGSQSMAWSAGNSSEDMAGIIISLAPPASDAGFIYYSV